jgi:hypothetical protein
MGKNTVSPRRKVTQVWIIGFVTLCLTLLAVPFLCWNSLSTIPPIIPSPAPAPDPFPDSDIVYGGGSKLGFLRADGSDVRTFPFRLPSLSFVSGWGRPFITGDNETLFVTSANYPGIIGHIWGVKPGGIATQCGWTGIAQLAADGYHILVDTKRDIEKYSPDDCGTENVPEKVYSGITGTLSPNEQYTAEVREEIVGKDSIPGIMIRNVQTGTEQVAGPGDFPAWSRDGDWLAYTGADGIYIVQNHADAVARRLAGLDSPEPQLEIPAYRPYPSTQYFPPIASWSPDGKWLVYHVYDESAVDPDDEAWGSGYSIFKVNVETGETIKLLDGGFSPFWRWPAETP